LILVHKYGGTSLDTREARRRLATRVAAAVASGWDVVVVVSAMGRRGAPYATDTLLDLVRGDCPGASPRELSLAYISGELLSTALVAAGLQAQGLRVVSLTGWQAGIITDGLVDDARIKEMRVQRVLDGLCGGKVVVVAGSQGMTGDGLVTTLGRGGSDTTACALGVALAADAVEIYTDTPGIMTADPQLVPDALPLPWLSHHACADLARLGARVMHPRAVQIAALSPSMRLCVRHSASDAAGTEIVAEPPHAGTVAGVSVLLGDALPGSAGAEPSGGPQSPWTRVSLVCEGYVPALPGLLAVAESLRIDGVPVPATAGEGSWASMWVPEQHGAVAARQLHRMALAEKTWQTTLPADA